MLDWVGRNWKNVMAYIRLPLGIKVALEYEVFGKVIVNVYHVTTSDPILTVKLFDIADVFEAWWTNTLAAEFSDDIGLAAITAHNLDVPNGEKITLPVSPAILGGSPNPAVSNNVALVASLRTALTGRSFRGRAYHAGLAEQMVADNVIDAAKTARMVDAYVDLIDRLSTENLLLVVASFQTEGAPRATGLATPVSSIIVNARIDTQRRRLPKS